MVLDAQTTEIFQEFRDNLNNAEKQRMLRLVDPSQLPKREKLILRGVYRYFWSIGKRKRDGESDEEQESNGDSDEATDGESKRKRARRGHPWKTFMDLESLSLSPAVEEHLNKRGTDATLFLQDPYKLEYGMESPAVNSLGDAFAISYVYMVDLETRSTMDTVRWCFQLLAFADIVKLIRPTATGARVGRLMEQDVVLVFEAIFAGDNERINGALENFKDWSKWGSKINHICERFGVGCIFFLAAYLTRNFLKHRFTWKYEKHDEAFDHLEELKLEELAKESQVNELGSRMREYLIKPFRDAKNRQGDSADQ